MGSTKIKHPPRLSKESLIYSNITENIACGNRPITAHDVKQKLVEYNQLCEFPELGFLV